jgi:hypothetical protein
VHKEEFSITCYMCEIRTLDEMRSIFRRDKPIFSSEKGCYIRTMAARFQLIKETLVMSVKGLDAKTN